MPLTIISGGQTGADQAGWRAARAAGLPTGGAMPRGFKTEDGPRPEFAAMYGARELATDDYPARTQRNVIESDATIWFGDPTSKGGDCTLTNCRAFNRPCLVVAEGVRPSEVAAWIVEKGVKVLNVAGNREGTAPGIGQRTEAFLARVFARLAGNDEPGPDLGRKGPARRPSDL